MDALHDEPSASPNEKPEEQRRPYERPTIRDLTPEEAEKLLQRLGHPWDSYKTR